MAETWLDRCTIFERAIVNGNHGDAKKLLKSYSREQRYECIAYIKDCKSIGNSTMWRYINICITGNFK